MCTMARSSDPSERSSWESYLLETSSDWRLDKKEQPDTPKQPDTPLTDISEIFCRLPLPFINEEFKIDFTWKDMDNKIEPPPYTHIRRNIYLVKKNRSDVDDDAGCTNCSSGCSDDCVCRVQCISCSKACRCSENCKNRPFRKEKKIRVVKTEFCGWGVEAAEPIENGGFIIEYVGEDSESPNLHNKFMVFVTTLGKLIIPSEFLTGHNISKAI